MLFSRIESPPIGLCQPIPTPVWIQGDYNPVVEHTPTLFIPESTQIIQMPIVQRRAFILVVDDDHAIGALLSDLLTEVGYNVVVQYDGDEAFDAACRDTPELILTDYMMPTSGEVLARWVRAHPKTKDVPIALMSSARPRLKDLEGIAFLPKPFDLDEVLAFVARFVKPQRYIHGDG